MSSIFKLISLSNPMATYSSRTPPYDLENSTSYTPIPDKPAASFAPAGHWRSKKLFAGILVSSFLLLSLVLLFVNQQPDPQTKVNGTNQEDSSTPKSISPTARTSPPSRGVSQGVSDKTFRLAGGENVTYAWTNVMLSWQRTAYHFQPEHNWMNDPNGPLFHKGWYHLFYQYNPESAVWGKISWGHAVSKDLIHWLYLPFAMVPDHWYDINGVWTGSATILPDGQIVMLYTGDTYDAVQVQCLAYPANLSDPLLLGWVKYSGNPVLVPPPGIGVKDFRDPTTAWLTPDGYKWRITIGSKFNKTGISLVYETVDFKSYDMLDGYLHAVPGTGMWECVDFFPVSMTEVNGLDTSVNGPGVKHVLKASLDDDKNDYYALGVYDPFENKWIPDDPELDVGIGLRYDYGKYYASKTFYDQITQRRILWGWIRETDSEDDDVLKGWASVQSIPRTVVFDQKTGSNIIQWPVSKVEELRSESVEFDNMKLGPGSIVPLRADTPSQLDIVASFEIVKEAFEGTVESNVDSSYSCPTSGGAANRGKLGPFGIIVLADETLSEGTPIYFYVTANGKAETHFCADELRSSEASDVAKVVYGSKVPVLDGEKYSLRSLVDHSIVESFAQGGRRVITSRIYPTKAINGAARVFLFNNATGVSVTASGKIWNMISADIRRFPFNQL
ncbi:acid beta-fructofuranosidase-like [Olea europaea var. sylvestris]|uniref:acid beta-fructofuranosidase-like n=1 Tax=Olea europaea var. sylvestris TaxID=158386 RepID=UPI000C1CE513|nr:acid beta-fructofuranosidase-like [Olea europaea var. sylvestris]